MHRAEEARRLAQQHPEDLFSWAYALVGITAVHLMRGEQQEAQAHADDFIVFATERELPGWLAEAQILDGLALAQQGHVAEGLLQVRRGQTISQSISPTEDSVQYSLILATVHAAAGAMNEGLLVIAKALARMEINGERGWEAEVYRLKGMLTLQKLSVVSHQLSVPNPQPLTPNSQVEVEREAEGYFRKAINIARQQQAKSLELRAVMSLVRLRQHQTTNNELRVQLSEAHTMLSELYAWFTEGFDTKDLQEAKKLIEELHD